MKRLSVNLATAPFVNRVAPVVAISAILGAALLLTLFNLTSFVLLGTEYRTARNVLKEQGQRLDALKKDMAEKEKILQSGSVTSLSEEAKFVARLLETKRFSWTRFLADVENIKPYGVMFQAVTPSVTPEGAVALNLRGQANPRSEMLKLEQNLFSSALFREVQLSSEQRQPGNPLTDFSITCIYLPEASDAP